MMVVFRRAAEKALDRITADRRRQIVSRIKDVAADPRRRTIGVKPLAGSGLFRLRVGDYRVLFSLDEAGGVLMVELIRMRGDICKRQPMSFALPKPKLVTDNEVVLSRDDWDRIVEILGDPAPGDDLAEDADDIAAVAAVRAEDAILAARIRGERGGSVEVTIPIEVIEAKLDGAHPIKGWREHRDWTQVHLSSISGVGRDLIAQIETRRKKGSIGTLDRFARALGVPIEALIEDK